MCLSRLKFVISVLVIALFLSACTVVPMAPAEPPVSSTPAQASPSTLMSPVAAPTLAVPPVDAPSAGKAVVTGRLIHFATGEPMVNQNLSLPAVLCPPGVAEKDKREQCVYVIDDAFDPSTLSDATGQFVFQDIAPGEFVLMVGNRMTKHVILVNDFNEPLIWKVAADEVLQLGDLVVDMP